MSQSFPETIPEPYDTNAKQSASYRNGWNQGHGLACQCVPNLGDRISPDVDFVGLGRYVTAENIRQYHEQLCEHHALGQSPGIETPEGSNAFEQGLVDAIAADLATYSNEDYGFSDENEDEEAPTPQPSLIVSLMPIPIGMNSSTASSKTPCGNLAVNGREEHGRQVRGGG